MRPLGSDARFKEEDGEFAAKHGIFRILADIDVCIDTRGIISNDIDFE